MRVERRGPERQAWVTWLAVGLVALVSVLLVVLATRLLGPDGYGRVALFLAALQMLYVVGVHWTMTAVVPPNPRAATPITVKSR